MPSCWNCGAEVETQALFCNACEVLQPPSPQSDFFDVLGVKPSFELDAADLERRFKLLSRKLHPDRFATASARERRHSLEHATTLNDAYRTLKAPLKRGEYLLARWGHPVASETSRIRLPMEFMEELMELREALGDAQLERDAGRVSQVLDQVEAGWQRHYQTTRALFESCLSAHSDSREARLGELEQAFLKLRYLNGILSENGRTPVPGSTTPSPV